MSARSILTAIGGASFLVLASTGCSGDAVRAQWEDRESLPTCGEVTLDNGETLEHSGRSALTCLRRAMVSGVGAEVVVHSWTTEGDPLTEYLRVTPAGTTEAYTDSTKDANSNREWSLAQCDHPGSVLDFAC